MSSKLIFVYNADAGVFNTLTDIAHKIFSPDTYQCHLCELTHGYFSVREEWTEFVAQLDVELEFLHRDEFIQASGVKQPDLPAIYEQGAGQPELLIGREKLNQLQSLADLKQAILDRLEAE